MPLAVATAFMAVVLWSWLAIGSAVLLLLWIWLMWLIGVQVRAMSWAELPEEIAIRRGRMWRRLVTVPYGRIQFVDVTAGPLERAFGLKELQLHTASATTDATVKGLEAPLADALRTRLTHHARERMSGL